MTEKVLVTGASGFLGGALAKELCSRGRSVRALVRKTSDTRALQVMGAHLMYGNLLDPVSLSDAMEGVEVVYHCAGCVREEPAEELNIANVRGTNHACMAALRKEVKRFVHVSSLAVINGNTARPLTDDMPHAAINPYGKSKIEAERIALHYRDRGLNVTIVRPSTIYGPGEPHFVELTVQLLKWRLLFLVGDGAAKWHPVYIDDAVEALLLAGSKEAEPGSTYIVAGRDIVTRAEAYNIMADILGERRPWRIRRAAAYILGATAGVVNRLAPFKIPFSPRSLAFLTNDWHCDISRAKSDLGFNPQVGITDGMEKTLEGY